MFWQRHEFAVFSKETTVAGRYIYIPSSSQFQPSLPPLPPSKTLIPGRIKVFGTKLHRESSIHAGMFFFFLVCSSNFSLAFPSPLVNYLSLPLCFCVWLHIVAHSERSPWIRQLRRILPPLVKSHRAKKKEEKSKEKCLWQDQSFRQNDLAAKWIPNGSAASSPPLSFGVSTSFGLDKVELRLFFFSVCLLVG